MKRSFMLLVAAALLLCWIVGCLNLTESEPTWAENLPVVVIDAGHGGMDGGASSRGGLLEKEVNLAVALKCRQVLALLGIQTVMTRTEDTALDEGQGSTIAARKANDIKKRVAMANASGGILVSIHMNSFTDAKYWGIQCFYSNNKESKAFGELMQETMRAVNPENTRSAKLIDKGIYLLNNVTVPAIIIECGFLSNAAEAAKLSEDKYRTKLALAICGGTYEYLNMDG